jgi:RHS repeat-associated protein
MHSFAKPIVRRVLDALLLLLLLAGASTRAGANEFYSMSHQLQLCQKMRAEIQSWPASTRVRIVDDCSLHFRQGPPVDAYDGAYRLGYLNWDDMSGWGGATYGFGFILAATGAARPEKNRGCDGTCGQGVHPGTGARSETTAVFRGGGAFPLRLDLHYGSNGNGLVMTPMQGSLGPGRSHTYVRHVRVVSAISTDDQPQEWAFATRPDGSVETYVASGADWRPEADNPHRLAAVRNAQGQVTGWRRDDADGGHELFDATGNVTAIVQRSGLAQTLAYDANGLLRAVRDPQGRELRFTHDGQGRLVRVETPDGGTIALAYVDGRLASITHPDQAVRRFLHGEAAYTDANDGRAADALTGVIDEAQVRESTTQYDGAHRVTRTFLAGGVADHRFAYQLAADGSHARVTTVTLPLGGTATLTHAAIAGRIRATAKSLACTGCLARAATQTWDAAANPDIGTGFDGVVTDQDVAADGLLARLTEAKGSPLERVLQVRWDAALRLPLQVDRPGQRRTYAYNARGQVVLDRLADTASGAQRTTTVAYCEAADVAAGACPLVGLRKSEDGPRLDVADTTTWTWRPGDHATCATNPTGCPYRKGDLWRITQPGGQVTEFLAWDGAGRLRSMQDPNGVVTDYEYSPRGWLTARKVRGADPAGEADDAITRVAYDAVGHPVQLTGPDGATLRFGYDAAHRLVALTDALGNLLRYALDAAGNRVRESALAGGTDERRRLARGYDALGLLAREDDAAGRATLYTRDATGEIDRASDPLGRTDDRDPDALGRLATAIRDLGGIEATSRFAYDARDHLVRATDPKGLATEYAFDGLDDLVQVLSPDTGSTRLVHDAAGNVVARTDARGVTIESTWDANGRLVLQRTPTDAQALRLEYDVAPADCGAGETFAVGRLARMTDASGNTRYCHDRQGRVVRKVQAVSGGSTLAVGTAYNGAGRVVAMSYPSGAVVTYVRDGNGDATRVEARPYATAATVTLVADVRRAPFGPVEALVFGNGRTQVRTLDADYRVAAIGETGGSGGFTAAYGRDAVGNVVALAERDLPARGYTYDGLDRVRGSTSAGVEVEAYTHDATGNRLTRRAGTTTTTYTYATTSHRLLGFSRQGARTYDAAGNTIAVAGSAPDELAHDDRNRLREIRVGGVVQRSYRYNGRGERVLRLTPTDSASSRQFVYDQAGHLLGEYLPSGARVAEYVWLDDLLVAVLKAHAGSTWQIVETDALGTPRAIIHPGTHATVWRWDLATTVFGEHAPSVDPDGNGLGYAFNLRYPGQYADGLGVHYNYLRDYDPATGRYIQSDPIGLRGGMNSYTYAGGNPMLRIDPLGLCWEYAQATGVLTHVDDDDATRRTVATNGYSGHGAGVNNPSMQHVQKEGPIPLGSYTIGRQQTHVGANGPLPASMRLTPDPDNEMHGRSGFLIHGDNSRGDRTASEGCIILARAIRNDIVASGDNCLRVVP